MNVFLLCVAIFAVCVLVGQLLYRKDTEKEERRKAAGRLAGIFRAKGVQHIPEFLEDYSVGDYSGMAKTIHKAVVLAEDPAHAEQMFDQMVDNVLAARAAGTTQDAALVAAVALQQKAAALIVKDSPSAPAPKA